MDGWTDRPTYRDAGTHLKMIGSGVGGIELMIDGFLKKEIYASEKKGNYRL